MYDTSDADGYVVYYNDIAKLVGGGDVKETTLNGLIPGTSYSIRVRAYQDIIGPPSTTLNAATDNGNSSCFLVYYSEIATSKALVRLQKQAISYNIINGFDYMRAG